MTEPLPVPEPRSWLPGEPEKITLPSGGWVQLRDPETLRNKHQKQIIRAINKTRQQYADSNNEDNETAWTVVEASMALMVTAWDLPYQPDPVENDDGTETPRDWVLPRLDPTMLDELRRSDFDALIEATKPHRTELFPPTPSPDDHADESSPTEPANE